MDLSGSYDYYYNDIRNLIIEANWFEVSQLIKINIIKKVIVAENLYKNLNEDDLKEITNLLISLRVLDKTSYHSLFDVTSQAKWRLRADLPMILHSYFPMGIPCVDSPAYLCEGGDCEDICPNM